MNVAVAGIEGDSLAVAKEPQTCTFHQALQWRKEALFTRNKQMKIFQAKSLDILEPIRQRFGLLLRNDLNGVYFLHENQDCYLVVVTQDGNEQASIEQINLDFIDDENGPVFTTDNSIFDNARRLVEEFDNVSIINCTPLLTEVASELIEYKFEYPDAKSN